MKRIPAALVKTWLFLIRSNNPQLAKQKFRAYHKVREIFGSSELAELYIEQDKDHDIEIVLV
jgi:hypothetical protein